MVVSTEFSAYGTKKSIVKSMVEDDHAKNVKSFYESIGSSVFYYTTLDKALEFLTNESKPRKNKIISVATRVKFLKPGKADSEDYHAVCLVRDSDDDYFFFDPNGPVLSGMGPDYHMFRYDNHENLSTSQLLRLLKKKYNIDSVDYEKKKEGIQLFAPTSNNSKYINEGGYCMFYIYLFINYLVEQEQVGLVDIAQLTRYVIHFKYSSNKSGVFPSKKSLPNRTVEIIDKIVF